MILRLSLDLPDKNTCIKAARVLSCTLLQQLEVVPDDIWHVETIIGELCANVIRHARSEGVEYNLTLECFQTHLVITVRDRGPGFYDGTLSSMGGVRTDRGGAERTGGYGVPLVQELTDRLEFFPTLPQGTTVRAEKALHYLSETAAGEAARLDALEGKAPKKWTVRTRRGTAPQRP